MIDYLLRKVVRHLAGKDQDGRLLIFNFHNITNKPGPLARNSLAYKDFEEQVRWINDQFEILPLAEGIDRCRSACLKEPSACITLDDGYRSQYSLAKPLFERLNVTATFFVSSGHLNKLLWNDHIPLFFHYADKAQKLEFLDQLNQADDTAGFKSHSVEDIELASIDTFMKYLPLKKRLPLLKFMTRYIPDEVVNGIMLSEEEVAEIADSKHTIGSHTRNHPILALEDDETSEKEITSDIEALHRIARKPVNIFAYPNGKPTIDYIERDINILMQKNIDYAVTTQPGYYSPGLDQMQIPRVNLVGNTSIAHFRTVISALRQPGKMIQSRGYESTC
jgi:peptidoglycan/xylan/chitin deacetylase (PgdA/CDA1 family)